jgi:PAS domain S-box-containing protein
MEATFSPVDEGKRLEALRSYAVLDTLPERALDELTELVSQICQAPMARISLVDECRQWFKSTVGEKSTETPRDVSFCAHALHLKDLLIVPDATVDERFANIPMVTERPAVRFYAGAPLRTPEGFVLGTLCVMDQVPRHLSPLQLRALRVLANQVMAHLELRRHLRSLQESEERSKAIVESALDAIITIDHEDRITEFNPAAQQMFGRSKDDVLGRELADVIIPPSQREAHRQGVTRYLQTQLTKVLDRRLELSALRADQTEFPVELTATRLGRSDPPRFTAFLRDITERQKSEEALRDSEYRLFKVFQSSPVGVAVNRWEAPAFVDVNPAFTALTGWSKEELLGRSALDIGLLSPETAQLIRAQLITDGALRSTDIEVQARDCRKLHFLAGIEFVEVRGEKHTVSTFVDVTERKRTEARFRRLVEADVQGVLFWNHLGVITEANDAFLQLLGYPRASLESGALTWMSITDPEFAERSEQALSDVADRGRCEPFENELLHRDGDRIPVLMGAAAFEDNNQEGFGFILDLRERKRLEQQFLRAQRLESIGTLASGIAHDLNNVLSPIILSVDLLKLKQTDPTVLEVLDHIGSNAERGAEMVRQVLSFSRGLKGRRLEVPLKGLLEDTEKLARETFPKNIEIGTHLPGPLWSVLGDPTQLHQALLNLCVNARDAMADGGRLRLSASNIHLDHQYLALIPEAKAGPYVLLQVEDNGRGIEPELLDKIFDPFVTLKEVGQGSGLGLSSTLAIVKSHGGFVRVRSEINQGTTVEIYLPAQKQDLQADSTEGVAILPRGNGETILVVDDELSVRQITGQTLEAFGYRVLLAEDGVDALATYTLQGPQIQAVLTDMMMPVMNGTTLIPILRKLNPHLPIVAASGYTPSERGGSPPLGVQHFISKPYTAELLLKVLRQVLEAN